MAIDELVAVLISGRYPKSPIPTRIAESHSGVAIYSMSVHTIVRDRRHEETRYRFQLVGLADGVDYFGARHGQPQRAARDQRRLHPPDEVLRRGPPAPVLAHGTHEARSDLRPPLLHPKPHRSKEAALTAEHMAFHKTTRFATFAVSFIGETPKKIWRVDRLAGIAAPGEPTHESSLQLDTHQTASTQFTSTAESTAASLGTGETNRQHLSGPSGRLDPLWQWPCVPLHKMSTFVKLGTR